MRKQKYVQVKITPSLKKGISTYLDKKGKIWFGCSNHLICSHCGADLSSDIICSCDKSNHTIFETLKEDYTIQPVKKE